MELGLKIKKVRDFILDLIFPKLCLSCGQENAYLCEDCLDKIPMVDKFICLGCGKISLFGQTCEKCKNKIFLDGFIYAIPYSQPIIRNAIKLFKYFGVKEMIDPLSKIIIKLIKNSHFLISNFSQNLDSFLIIPLPLHRKKFLWRGYNQSELLARKLSQEYEIPINDKILIKIKKTRSQTDLKENERVANVKNVFATSPVRTSNKTLDFFKIIFHHKKNNFRKNIISNGVKNETELKGKIIFLIDDVVTTGSTLNEAAKVLKKSGAAQVWGITIARG